MILLRRNVLKHTIKISNINLENKLYDLEFQKQIKETTNLRYSQVGKVYFSELIKTYIFPQSRLTNYL